MNKLEILEQLVKGKCTLEDLYNELELLIFKEKKSLQTIDEFFKMQEREFLNLLIINEPAIWKIRHNKRIGWDVCESIIEIVGEVWEARNHPEAQLEYEKEYEKCENEIKKEPTFDYLSPMVRMIIGEDLSDLHEPIQSAWANYLPIYQEKYEIFLKADTLDYDIKKKNIESKIKLYKDYVKNLEEELEKLS